MRIKQNSTTISAKYTSEEKAGRSLLNVFKSVNAGRDAPSNPLVNVWRRRQTSEELLVIRRDGHAATAARSHVVHLDANDTKVARTHAYSHLLLRSGLRSNWQEI